MRHNAGLRFHPHFQRIKSRPEYLGRILQIKRGNSWGVLRSSKDSIMLFLTTRVCKDQTVCLAGKLGVNMVMRTSSSGSFRSRLGAGTREYPWAFAESMTRSVRTLFCLLLCFAEGWPALQCLESRGSNAEATRGNFVIRSSVCSWLAMNHG